jgi:hypothetical protein
LVCGDFGGMPIPMPPPQYDHKPSIVVYENRVAPDQVQARCNALYGRPIVPAGACTRFGTSQGHRVCMIVIPNSPYMALYRRHELAHCNGWPADHRGTVRWMVPGVDG